MAVAVGGSYEHMLRTPGSALGEFVAAWSGGTPDPGRSAVKRGVFQT
jgi:hypothetical protein